MTSATTRNFNNNTNQTFNYSRILSKVNLDIKDKAVPLTNRAQNFKNDQQNKK